jgi:hypothetical protein
METCPSGPMYSSLILDSFKSTSQRRLAGIFSLICPSTARNPGLKSLVISLKHGTVIFPADPGSQNLNLANSYNSR